MNTMDILKEQEFEEIREVKADSKHRIYLGVEIETIPATAIYKIYRNSTGQLILDPQITIPASEAWVYQNPRVFKAIQSGLKDAKEGKAKRSKEDFSKYVSGD